MEFRNLRADEIEVRVAQASQYGVNLLLYKNSRVDQNILDEVVGPENWQKDFYTCNDTLFCRVGILCDSKLTGGYDWVWKSDAGEPSNMSAVKGEASDAFKRACFNWGIGRELYTSPRIHVHNTVRKGNSNIVLCNLRQKGTKWQCFDEFSVERIRIVDGAITGLAIRNDTLKKRCFLWEKI